MQKHDISVMVKGRVNDATWCQLDDARDLHDHFESIAGATKYDDTEADKWTGASYSDTLTGLTRGDVAAVANSDKMLDKLEAMLPDIESNTHQTRASVAGGVVNVGAMMAGHPAHMRVRRKVMADTGPVGVLVDLAVSGGVSASVIARRGAAALALTRILSRSRPVSLYMIGGLRTNEDTALISIKIDTAPLDLARAAFMLQDPAMLRRCFFAICQNQSRKPTRKSGLVQWAFENHRWQKENLAAEMARRLDLDDFTAVGGTHLDDTRDLASDAAAADWVGKEATRLLSSTAAMAA